MRIAYRQMLNFIPTHRIHNVFLSRDKRGGGQLAVRDGTFSEEKGHRPLFHFVDLFLTTESRCPV